MAEQIEQALPFGEQPSAKDLSGVNQDGKMKLGSIGFTSNETTLSSSIGQPLAQILKRPEMIIEHLAPLLRDQLPAFFQRLPFANIQSLAKLSSEVRNELKSIETEIKYAGYLDQQQRSIDRLKKAEQRRIPDWFDYRAVSGLSREMQEKLGHVVPQTLGQASRIPGVTPAAVSLINVYIEIQARRRDQAAAL